MDVVDGSATQAASNTTPEECVPVVALASAVAFAAATSLLAWTFLPNQRRRSSAAGQISLGVLAGCAAAVIWQKRQEEVNAARHLFTHMHEVRDARWLKKHPIAYG